MTQPLQSRDAESDATVHFNAGLVVVEWPGKFEESEIFISRFAPKVTHHH